MSDAPKIVLDRLRAATPGETHPDADVLAAFTEQALSGAEREGVVRHLARCGECREVVALSIPPSVEAEARPSVVENETAARATTGRSRARFEWPNLRWAAVAASVVVVGSVLLLHPGQQTAPTPGTEKLAAHTSSPAPTLDAAISSTAPAPLTQARTEAPAAKRDTATMPEMRSGVRDERALGSNRTRATQSIPLADSPRKDEDLGTLRGGLVGGANAPAAPTPAAASADRIASASETVEVTAAQPQINTDATAAGPIITSQEAEAVGGVSKSVQSLSVNGREGAQLSPIVKAKPAAKEKDEVQAENKVQDSAADKKSSYAYSANPGLVLQKQQLKRSTDTPKWSLAQGKLQRSLDSGATWQTALQLEHPLLSFGVSATGSDVWAGGQSGMLFHSTNGGATWSIIQPATKAGALAADIVAIEVRGAAKIVLTTSNHESWTTVDAGKTWEKK